MRFLDRSTCEQLVKLGLKSQSGFYWREDNPYYYIECYNTCFKEDGTPGQTGFKIEEYTYHVPAFTLSDFLETEEYAKENRRLFWPEKKPANFLECVGWKPELKYLELFFARDWIEYIKQALEERVK